MARIREAGLVLRTFVCRRQTDASSGDSRPAEKDRMSAELGGDCQKKLRPYESGEASIGRDSCMSCRRTGHGKGQAVRRRSLEMVGRAEIRCASCARVVEATSRRR